MTKELQDHVWSILPKEFKEEVKEIYLNAVVHHPCGYNYKTDLLKYLFGRHNLTSDAEEEEMLMVSRSAVIAEMNKLHKYSYQIPDLQLGLNALTALFGSKCLPDEINEDNFTNKKPKPAEQREDLIPPNSGELESQEAVKQFNTIIKDSFAKERRLNIAAQIVASMVGSDDWTTWRGGTNKEIWHNIAKASLEIADALIDECEKKGGIK